MAGAIVSCNCIYLDDARGDVEFKVLPKMPPAGIPELAITAGNCYFVFKKFTLSQANQLLDAAAEVVRRIAEQTPAVQAVPEDVVDAEAV